MKQEITNQGTITVTKLGLHSVNHRFITHIKKESNQDSFLIMEETGLAFGRVYYYKDDSETIYLDWLSVKESARNNGLGTLLQELREEIGRQMKFTKSCLWVENGTWMHEWYKRRGYQDWVKHKTEPNAIWMRKSL
jgi:N-acetylglutamate synthase-like GNAT family acetyltransferase